MQPPTIHTVTAPSEGILVNAYLVETSHGVVAVDSALRVSDARALRATLDSLGKPLLAVLLTHGHPDHYNGVGTLVAGRDVPIYATEAVSKVIKEWDAAKETQWKPVFGEEWPAQRTFPNHTLKDRETLVVDGLTWTVHDVGPGESHADSYWELGGEDARYFLGDIVLHGEHAYVADGHTTAWLATLAELRDRLKDARHLHPGHGATGGVDMLRWQEKYLQDYRSEVDALRHGNDALTQTEKDQLTARMTARYPMAGLSFLIASGADAVASELAKQESQAPAR